MTIADPSIITFVDVSNYLELGLLDGLYATTIIQNDYAILSPKKPGTTRMTFDNGDKVVEVTVTKVDGKFETSFKEVTAVTPPVVTPTV